MPHQAEARVSAKTRREADESRRILQIAKGLSATLGNDFFHSAVKHLANAFHADCVYLGEVAGSSPVDRIRTLAEFRHHEPAHGFEQKLSGTTAGQVISDGWFGCSREVRRRFPLDDVMEVLEAEGYIGLRLSDSAGQVIGLIAVASKARFNNIALVKSVVETFVPRAAAELERKRQEDIYRETEERHRAFIASNPDAMWRIELDQPVPLSLSEEEQIRHIYQHAYLAECNDALARLAGMERGEDLVGRRFGQVAALTHPGAREELRSAIRSGFRTATVETSPQDHTGQRVYRLRTQFGIVESGTLHRIWGTTRDITALRRTELFLDASERRFREVLHGIQLPAVMIDEQGTVTFANDCFLRLAERSTEEVSALTWLSDFVPESESDLWKQTVQGNGHARPTAVHIEGTLIPKDGPRRLISWDTISLYDENNEPAGVAAVGRDITHQRVFEQEIRQAQKLESIGRLAAGVAHDFNNLLMVVLIHTKRVLQDLNESNPTYESLTAIESAATRCRQLCGKLLAFGRKQHLQPERINLNDLITADEGVLRSLIGPGVELILKLAPIGLVDADAMQMQRALANLVSNASDAMPGGGKIVISTSNITVGAEDAAYPRVDPGAYVRLSVSDSGPGLSDEALKHMFEPFFTTKEPGKGTGLGLPTVYGIVAQSGGHIVVHSKPGKDTRFEILLPESRDAGQEEVPPGSLIH